ncbi:hypothetical protein MPTK2_8g11930 [Marchantia polymorpha subsp. ruderalis]
MAMVVLPTSPGFLTVPSYCRGAEGSLGTCPSWQAMNSIVFSPFSSSCRLRFVWNPIDIRHLGVGKQRRRCRISNSSPAGQAAGEGFNEHSLEFESRTRAHLLRSPVCSLSVSLPGCSAAFDRHKLNGKLRFGRQRRGVVVAVSASSRGQDSEEGDADEQGQNREDVEDVREIIDVPNEVEARNARIEAEIRSKEEHKQYRESLESRRKKFLHNLKEQHKVYKADRDEWGIGLKPIFTVYEDAQGKRYKVDVDEDEIWLRSGVDPLFPQFADDEAREVVERNIAKANSLARKIVEGSYEPNELSVLYKFQKAGQETTVGSVRWDGDKDTSQNYLPAPLQKMNFVTVFALTVVGGFAYKWWTGRKPKVPNPVVDEQEARLMKMRKLKAKMNQKQVIENPEVIEQDPPKKGGDAAGNKREPPEVEAKNAVVDVTPTPTPGLKPSFEDGEFQKKVEEIRAMAREARLQEERNADLRFEKNSERTQRQRSMEEEMQEKNRAKELEALAKNLDDVRRLGSLDGDLTSTPDMDFKEKSLNLGSEVAAKPQNGKPPTVQKLESSKSDSNSASGNGMPKKPESTMPTNGKAVPPAQPSVGVKPRIILSPKEARASIAAKRARLESGDASPSTGKAGFSENMKAKIKSKRAKAAAEAAKGIAKDAFNGASRGSPNELSQDVSSATSQEELNSDVGGISDRVTTNGQVSRLDAEPVPAVQSGQRDNGASLNGASSKTSAEGSSEQPVPESKIEERKVGKGGEKKPKSSKEEEEEQEWMSDEVLRDIVFKVQANEEAGREPFFNLNSEQEKRFFKGLERKFEREGDRVKSWIKDRVENIDYGADGVSLMDPPESYTAKWKEGADPSGQTSDLAKKFSEDRKRILKKQSGLDYTSSPSIDEDEDVRPKQSSSSPVSPSVSPSNVTTTNVGRGKAKETKSGTAKTTVTSSGRPAAFTPNLPSNGENEEEQVENWQNTKRWAQDLQRKYELEKDPETRALMREIGQDLDRWITEDEIEEANRLLEKGVEGEQEYVRMHYEKTKAKIKEQRDLFGREAMMNKYGEYKPEQEEPELWWFDLPYVLCLGLQSRIEGEMQSGLYSVDMSPAMEGVGNSSGMVHTVAFQDRGDAHNFSRLLEQESEKLGAEAVQVVPFDPKELYRDAGAEGYKVTVIKKGQLQLSIDQTLEEVESRILEIGTARYYEDLLRDRSIDMDAVLDDGLGYGQTPQI